jgi:hypothetical protein
MEPNESYNDILQMTQRRAARIAKRNNFINIGLVVSIAAMVAAIFVAGNSYQALQEAKQQIALKNDTLNLKNDALKLAKLEAESSRDDARESKRRSDSMSKYIDSLIAKNPKDAPAILKRLNSKTDNARSYSQQGYQLLKEKKFAAALRAFQDSENAYYGYKDSYELARLLRKNQDKFDNINGQKYLLQKIYNEFNYLKVLTKDDLK